MSDLAQRVQQRQAAGKDGPTLDELVARYEGDFQKALPAVVAPHLSSERFVRLALNELRFKPELRECDAFSLIGAYMQVAQLGLEPSGPLEHVYLIPRNVNVGTKQKPEWVRRVQLIVGYKGLVELARRTGAVRTIEGDVVYERDDFTFRRVGGSIELIHDADWFGSDRGDPIGSYAVADMVDGSAIARTVSLEEIMRAKTASEAGRKGVGPWETDWQAMWIKTGVRRLWKWLPQTPEGAVAWQTDGRVFHPDAMEELEVPISERPVLDVVAIEPEAGGEDGEEASEQAPEGSQPDAEAQAPPSEDE